MRKLLFPLCLILFTACTTDPAAQIERLEADLSPSYRPGAVDSLLLLYRQAADAGPSDHAAAINYLYRGALLQFERKQQAQDALHWLDEALTQHGEGQPLSKPVGLLARIYQAYSYRLPSTARLTEADVQTLRALLEQNRPWIDSSLKMLEMDMGLPVVKDPQKAAEFIDIAEGYAKWLAEADSNKTVNLYLIAAGLAKTIEKPNKALELYYEVAEKHPQHPKAPTALFMMGHIYEDDLNDLERAKSAYVTFLERYPKDPDYADDAANALKYLGKSPEELIREFEKTNK